MEVRNLKVEWWFNSNIFVMSSLLTMFRLSFESSSATIIAIITSQGKWLCRFSSLKWMFNEHTSMWKALDFLNIINISLVIKTEYNYNICDPECRTCLTLNLKICIVQHVLITKLIIYCIQEIQSFSTRLYLNKENNFLLLLLFIFPFQLIIYLFCIPIFYLIY